jgi:hypothetical protein
MTVKVTQPSTNLREKINELDYDRIPYEKMPAGSVIQVQYYYQTGSGAVNEAETSSSSFQPTLFNVDISPKFSNSLIIIQAAPNIKSNGGSAYHALGLYKSINGGSYTRVLPPGGSAGASPHGLTNWRFTGETLWYANAPIFQIDQPGTTESINYKIFHRVSSNGAYVVRTGENGADEYMMVMEIKQ